MVEGDGYWSCHWSNVYPCTQRILVEYRLGNRVYSGFDSCLHDSFFTDPSPFSGKFSEGPYQSEEAVNAMNFLTNPIYLVLSSLVRALYFPMVPILGTILYFNGKAREEVISEPTQDVTA